MITVDGALQAAKTGDIKALRSLKSRSLRHDVLTDESGATCVHYAARSGNIEVLDFLVRQCGFPGCPRSNVGSTPALDAAAAGNLNGLIWLLKNTECQLEDRDHTGACVVHLAARFGHLHVLRWLIDKAACAALDRTHTGALPLHFAAARGDLDSVKFLVEEKPGSVNLQMDNGATPAYLATQEGKLEVLKYLVEEAGCSTKLAAFDGMSCLHAAAQIGWLECVSWLVKSQGCSPNERDCEGATPLHFAALRGHAVVLEWLLNNGARISLDNLGGSPLHDAAENGNIQCVLLLLKFGCDGRVHDNTGMTAADLAIQCGHIDIAALLRKHAERIGHKIDNSVYVQRPTLQNGFKVTGVRNGPITNGSLKGMATNNGSDDGHVYADPYLLRNTNKQTNGKNTVYDTPKVLYKTDIQLNNGKAQDRNKYYSAMQWRHHSDVPMLSIPPPPDTPPPPTPVSPFPAHRSISVDAMSNHSSSISSLTLSEGQITSGAGSDEFMVSTLNNLGTMYGQLPDRPPIVDHYKVPTLRRRTSTIEECEEESLAEESIRKSPEKGSVDKGKFDRSVKDHYSVPTSMFRNNVNKETPANTVPNQSQISPSKSGIQNNISVNSENKVDENGIKSNSSKLSYGLLKPQSGPVYSNLTPSSGTDYNENQTKQTSNYFSHSENNSSESNADHIETTLQNDLKSEEQNIRGQTGSSITDSSSTITEFDSVDDSIVIKQVDNKTQIILIESSSTMSPTSTTKTATRTTPAQQPDDGDKINSLVKDVRNRFEQTNTSPSRTVKPGAPPPQIIPTPPGSPPQVIKSTIPPPPPPPPPPPLPPPMTVLTPSARKSSSQSLNSESLQNVSKNLKAVEQKAKPQTTDLIAELKTMNGMASLKRTKSRLFDREAPKSPAVYRSYKALDTEKRTGKVIYQSGGPNLVGDQNGNSNGIVSRRHSAINKGSPKTNFVDSALKRTSSVSPVGQRKVIGSVTVTMKNKSDLDAKNINIRTSTPEIHLTNNNKMSTSPKKDLNYNDRIDQIDNASPKHSSTDRNENISIQRISGIKKTEFDVKKKENESSAVKRPPSVPPKQFKTSNRPESVKLSSEFSPSKFIEQIPHKDGAGRDIPGWKRQILARQLAEKSQAEHEERLKIEQEEARFRDMPAWKRAIIEKKEAENRDGNKDKDKKMNIVSTLIEV